MPSLFLSSALIGLLMFGFGTPDPRCENHPELRRCQPAVTYAPIGIVGCSNTEDAIENDGGYLTQSDEDLLGNSATGGATLARWDWSKRNYWELYDRYRPPEGYQAVWWQLCVRTREGPDHEGQMDSVLAQIYERDPGVPVYVSWVNHYTFNACRQVDWGAEDRLLDYATSLGLLTGPWLGPLNESQVVDDNCHPNQAGWSLLGSQLVDFFDS